MALWIVEANRGPYHLSSQKIWYLHLAKNISIALHLSRDCLDMDIGLTCPEESGAELEDLEELGVPEAGGDFPVLGQTAAGVRLGYLVHLTDQLGQELDPHHAVLGRT